VPRTHFSGRTLARSQALQLLFQAEATHRLVSEVLEGDYALDELLVDGYHKELASRELEPQELDERLSDLKNYTRELALGTDEMVHELDAIIERASENWSVSRMPSVDRNLLRIALFEILCVDDVDTAVAIDECVELAKAYGTDDSWRFVNGILGKIVRRIDAGEDVLAQAIDELDAQKQETGEFEEPAEGDAANGNVESDEEVEQELPDWAQE
jgi:N utilization substance protein B